MGLPLEPEFKEPHIKGSIIRSAKEWIIKTYGRDLYDRALAAIPKDMQPMVDGEILSVGWYPLDTWTTFMNSVRREVKRTTGEDPADFDRRNIFEAGRNTLLKVYRFVLSLFDPVGAVEKLVPVMNRVYTHGKIEVVSHEPGKLTMRFTEAPMSMREEIERQFPISCEFMLHLAGQQVTQLRPTFTQEGANFSLLLKMDYKRGN